MFGFPKDSRLLKSSQYRSVMDSRKSLKHVSPYFVLLTSSHIDEDSSSRVGIIASRKYGNAVRRNRFKRVVREEFRKMKHKLEGVDMIVIARKRAGHVSPHLLRTSLIESMQAFQAN